MGVPALKRYIFHNGELNEAGGKLDLAQFFPGGLFSGVLPTIWNVKKNQFEKKYSDPANVVPPEEDMSVAEWLRSIGVSQSVIDNLISAMLHGIHGGSPDELSARLVFDSIYWRYYNLHNPEQVMPQENEIIEKLWGAQPSFIADPAGPRLSMMHFGPLGMSVLPDSIAHMLESAPNVTIKKNSPINDISYEKDMNKVAVSCLSQPNRCSPSQTLTSSL